MRILIEKNEHWLLFDLSMENVYFYTYFYVIIFTLNA